MGKRNKLILWFHTFFHQLLHPLKLFVYGLNNLLPILSSNQPIMNMIANCTCSWSSWWSLSLLNDCTTSFSNLFNKCFMKPLIISNNSFDSKCIIIKQYVNGIPFLLIIPYETSANWVVLWLPQIMMFLTSSTFA